MLKLTVLALNTLPTDIMTKTYKLPMSLEDWQCYLDTPQEVVDLINTLCEKALKRSKDPKSALFNVYTVLNNFVEFGLRDTECDHVAVRVVNLSLIHI